MRLCPHCANPIEEDAWTCPFCKGALERDRWTLQGSQQETDSGVSKRTDTEKEGSVLKIVGYLLVLVLVALGAFLAGWLMPRSRSDPGSMGNRFEGQSQETREESKPVEPLDDQIAQLRKELEESSKEVAGLRARIEKTDRMLASAQERERSKGVSREAQAAASSGQPATVERPAAEPVPAGTGQRAAEPGAYEVIRTTDVFERPSESSRKLAMITRGMKVNIVSSTGDWLEVRSSRGNPPGFIRREDAMFIQAAK